MSVIYKQQFLIWLANNIYLAALCASMLSVCFLISRITRVTRQVRIAYGIAVLNVLWAVASIATIAFQCKLPIPWRTRPHSRCIDVVS